MPHYQKLNAMKKLLFITFIVFSSLMINAQDILIMQSGEEIETKIVEVNPTQVKYTLYGDPESPIYIVNRVDAFKIKYASGTETVLNEHKLVEETELSLPSRRREGLAVRPEFGGTMITEDKLVNAMKSLDASLTVVYQFSKKFSLGGGAAYYKVKDFGNFLPLYLNMRGYFKNRLSSPYYDLRVGHAIPTEEFNGPTNESMTQYSVQRIAGTYVRFGVGMDVRNIILGISVGICTNKVATYSRPTTSDNFKKTGDYGENEVFFGLNIGYNIQCTKR